MLKLHEEADGKIVNVHLSGKLTRADYHHFIPEVDRLIAKHGTIRVLCLMEDFHGWEMGALWEDIKFEVKHFADIERLALVGQSKWQAGMATFCKPFTRATVRYFDSRDARLAEEWIAAGLPTAAAHAAVDTPMSSRHDRVQEASEDSFPASDAPAY
jgi:hypothetical protein